MDRGAPDAGLGKEPLLTDLLRRLFAGKAIYYFVDEPGNIILTKDFAVKSFASGTIPSDNLLPRQDRSEDKERTAVSEYLIYEIGNPAEKARQGNISITGYIRDKNSGEPLRGVTVFIGELAQGTATDANGFYLVNLPRGSYNFRFSYLGMKETGCQHAGIRKRLA